MRDIVLKTLVQKNLLVLYYSSLRQTGVSQAPSELFGYLKATVPRNQGFKQGYCPKYS